MAGAKVFERVVAAGPESLGSPVPASKPLDCGSYLRERPAREWEREARRIRERWLRERGKRQ